MKFGVRIRQLRLAKEMTLRELAQKVGVGFTYLSKIENHKLKAGNHPSECLIHKLAEELDVSENELLILADKVPLLVRSRFQQRPEVFMALAACDDSTLDTLMAHVREASGANTNEVGD